MKKTRQTKGVWLPMKSMKEEPSEEGQPTSQTSLYQACEDRKEMKEKREAVCEGAGEEETR